MAVKNSITGDEKERKETIEKILEYKLPSEANVVSIIYKKPSLLLDTNLSINDFSIKEWKVLFAIAYELVVKEKKNSLDDITIGFYLEKHDKLREKYEEFGGYDTIKKAMGYVAVENFEGYVAELRKWYSVLSLCVNGFPVKEKLHKFVDMTSTEIYQSYEVLLNSTFINLDSDIKAYDICDGIFELIEELDQGDECGLPYNNLPMLNETIGGQKKGNITLIGGVSNAGKSTFLRNAVLPTSINSNNRYVIIINEEGKKKWQIELIVWVANNIYDFNLQKKIVKKGKYGSEVKEMIMKCAEWLSDKTQNKIITLLPFQRFTSQKAIQVIRKYANLGVENFILDTFKMDAGTQGDNSWLQMQQSMVDIYDVVKPEALNLNILITFQLNKASSKQRFFTQDNIGVAKNIVDPTSTCIMIRDVLPDEYEGEKHELNIYRLEGKNNKTKVEVKLDRNKRYQVLFIVKNRDGAANQYQIVIEHDLSRNIIKEVGVVNIRPDF